MASTKSTRKKQTKLSFSPLPSSSPARANQPEAVRDRAAAVAFTDESKPTKRRKTIREFLPQPSASSEKLSQAISEDPSSESRITRSFMSSQSRPQSNITRATNPALTQLHSLGIFDESESDTPNMFSSPTKRPRAQKVESILDEDDSSSQEERDKTPPRNKRRAIKGKPSGHETAQSDPKSPDEATRKGNSDEEDDDELPSRPRRRMSRPVRDQDEADIDEDLEFLGEVDVESPRAFRQVSEKKSAKQQALDALRKRRLQRGAQSHDGEGSNTATGQKEDIDDDEDDDDTGTDNDENDNGVNDDTTFREDEDEDEDEDFIVDDDGNDAIGEPVELPFEFSHYRSMKPKELFKFIVEWMVQKKINPAFSMEDQVYQISFDRLDDYVRGLGGSKFVSSAWTPAFSKALKSRPTLKSLHLGDELLFRDRCDACNRSGHPATWEASFQGNTYNKDSLEEDSESDSDDAGGSNKESPGGVETFYIGRFCMGNASVAHALAHWRFHLNEWVIDYLKNVGELSSEKIIRRDKWSISKRRKEAEKIVDSMEIDGEVRRLYRDFKNQVTEAQFANDRSGFELSSP